MLCSITVCLNLFIIVAIDTSHYGVLKSSGAVRGTQRGCTCTFNAIDFGGKFTVKSLTAGFDSSVQHLTCND